MTIPIGILSQAAGGLGYWLARTDSGGYQTNFSADLVFTDDLLLASGDSTPNQIAIRRISKTGVLQSQYSLARANYVDPIDLAVDTADNAYVLNYDSSAAYIVFNIIKCSSTTTVGGAGTISWQKRFAGTTPFDIQGIPSIDTDSANNVYLSAWIYVYATTPYYCNLLVKYNSSGTFQFAKTARTSTNPTGCNAIGCHNSLTDVYVAGYGGANSDGLIIKYTSAGAVSWARQFTSGSGVSLDTDPDSIAVASDGTVYVLFSGGTSANRDNTLVKYNSSGTLQWQRKTTESIGADQSVSIGSDGGIYIGTNQGRIFKFDSSGTLVWKRIITGMDYGNSAGIFSIGTEFYYPGNQLVLYAPTDGTTGPIPGSSPYVYTYAEETATTWSAGNGTSSTVTITGADFAGSTTNTDFALSTVSDTITKVDW